MGIRELAEAAKVAEEAAAAAEKKRLWALNARRGEKTVLDLLGVEGKAVRAYNDKEREFGDGTTVYLEDGIWVAVRSHTIYGERSYYGGLAPVIGTEPTLVLTNEKGITRTGSFDSFTTLAGLGDELKKSEEREASYAAAKARGEAARAAAGK